MNPRCLSCKHPLHSSHGLSRFGEFCSEFCYANHPKNTDNRASPKWQVAPLAHSRGNTERILEKNHGILLSFKAWAKSPSAFSDVGALQWLKRRGFDFDYHTRLVRQADGRTEVWCYDTGYRIDARGRVEAI